VKQPESFRRFDIHLAAALGPPEAAAAAQEKRRASGRHRWWRPDISARPGRYSGPMLTARRLPALLLVVLALAAAACGSTPSPTPRPSPTPVPTPTPTPRPTIPPGPEVQQVQVVAAGVGVYQITTIPVAVVRNLAGGHAATSVQVRFAVFNTANQPVGGTDVNIPYIAPGQTMAIAGRIEQSGNLHASASVIGAQWTAASPGDPLSVGGVTYTCGTCRPGPGYGTAAGTLSAAVGVSVSSLTLTGVCYAGNRIVGGDTSAETVTTLPKPIQEPVIISEVPDRCEIYASPGS
jgi:hypothetical protein